MLTPVVVKEELEGNGLGGWIFSGSKHFAPSEEPPVLLGKVDSPAVLRISQLRDRLPLNRPTVGVFTGPRLQSCHGAGQGNHRRGGWGAFTGGWSSHPPLTGPFRCWKMAGAERSLGQAEWLQGPLFPWSIPGLGEVCAWQGDRGMPVRRCARSTLRGAHRPLQRSRAPLFSPPPPPLFFCSPVTTLSNTSAV